MEVFKFIEPEKPRVPILVSVPHSGTHFPEDVRSTFESEAIKSSDDTDWFVDKLYDFVPSLGIPMIVANHHRWVIDLNRHPTSKPLYDDGRNITELCPTSTFNEEPIYKEDQLPDAKEIERRIKNYYDPYYTKIEEVLQSYVDEFGIALLWDAHSIKQHVPGIREEVFPDLILGDNDGKSANEGLINLTLAHLEKGHYHLEHNFPFKGGNITRFFGNPEKNRHALQLEMTKINYMDNDEKHYDEERAGHVRKLLRTVFESLIEKLPHERI